MSKIVPSPKSLPFIGTLFSLIKEGGGPQLHKYVTKRHKELGSIYKEKIGPVEAYFLNDPVDMRKVFAAEGVYPVHVLPECWTKYNSMYGCNRGLYFMDGEEWMKIRKIMNKYLLKNFNAHLQHELTRELFKTFQYNMVSYHDGFSSIELESSLYQLSINFIIAYMLGTPFSSHCNSLTSEVKELSHVVVKIFEYSVSLSLLPIDLSVKLKLPAWTKFVQTVDRTLALASVICDRLEKFSGDGLMSQLKEENVSSDLIRKIVIDLILAAADTTSTSTQWILYLLGRHPLIQTQLVEELSKKKNLPCYEVDMMNHIIRESHRLYPVAPFIGRYMPQDTQIGGFLIPQNSLVLLSVYSSSHDPTHFPSPDQFQPSRWSRDYNNKYINVKDSFASIPYALGARSCIGRKLVHLQMSLTIAQIVNNYHIHVQAPVDVVLKLITVPSEPIRFQLLPR